MDESADEARRTSFDRKAEQYEAVRPGYPEALIEAVMARCGAMRLLEIGAGTGKATMGFAKEGREIVAIEPGEKLAEVLERRVAGMANVRVVRTTFEAYEGSGFELIYAAQAIHWVDPAVRYTKSARLLRPGGWLAVIRNEKPPQDTALQRELDAVYAQVFAESQAPLPLARVEARWTGEIDDSGCFGPVHIERVPWSVYLTTGEYLLLLDTYSDHATLDEGRREVLYRRLREVLARHGGGIELHYVALAFVAQVRRGAEAADKG